MKINCKDIAFGTGECAYAIYLPWKVKFDWEDELERVLKCVSIDKCLLPEILQLWEQGIKTTGCCCGHGNFKMAYIGVKFEDIQKMKDLGYEVYFNHLRPKDEDSFIPKNKLKYKVEPEEIRELNSGWIPVSERLPEIDDYYLTTWQGYHSIEPVTRFNRFSCGRFEVDGIKAWQPLPEPYKEVEND